MPPAVRHTAGTRPRRLRRPGCASCAARSRGSRRIPFGTPGIGTGIRGSPRCVARAICCYRGTTTLLPRPLRRRMLSQLHRDRACAARQVKEPAWFHCSHTVVLRNEWRWLHGRPVLLMIRSRAVQAHAQPHKAADPRRTATRPMGSCCAAARGCALAARRHQGGSATRRRVARASSQ